MSDELIPHDVELIRARLARHAPHWADLAVSETATRGTDNAMYRLGPALALRVPRRVSAKGLLAKEAAWLLRFGPLSLAIPRPHLMIAPEPGSPYPIVVVDWLEGARADTFADPVETAKDLAWFLRGLQSQPTRGAPTAGADNHFRGAPLRTRDAAVTAALETLQDELDHSAAHTIWQAALDAPEHEGPPVWVHGDLVARNALVRAGNLVAILDWGLAAIGDPAVDYAARWTWLPEDAEDAFVASANQSEACWSRARGWALSMAVVALAHYRTAPDEDDLCRICRATLARLGL